MGNTSSTPVPPPTKTIRRNEKGQPLDEEGNPLKPCCACPDTKRVRDQCMLEKGDEEACADLIRAHKQCLRDLGFKI
ncbi:cytochrome C oxidase copper chaperone-domain-containing protein [Piptocephalis cylindrospora]|uniref:Cytochrome C oxidase copper chaperone-domain-containing protein n=1 Tax=Piptocephalis cylindrospora TaxID=1907219 RepID=A0A4P9Y6N6_9FUNG|nr:cytochrome C oxidase copper chaperone-domain-containing protein [Piptocephalis cylindrospora]|eukprot:RKP14462.1 cytochrome C oxidase copper chaperone-domain-containing protein [Piptocephalis cylindrospora]